MHILRGRGEWGITENEFFSYQYIQSFEMVGFNNKVSHCYC